MEWDDFPSLGGEIDDDHGIANVAGFPDPHHQDLESLSPSRKSSLSESAHGELQYMNQQLHSSQPQIKSGRIAPISIKLGAVPQVSVAMSSAGSGDSKMEDPLTTTKYPIISIIDFDDKLPSRSKRHEFEPIPEATFLNLSEFALQSTWIDKAGDRIVVDHSKTNDIPATKQKSFPTDTLTNVERELFSSFFKDEEQNQYLHIRNSILSLYHTDPSHYLSLSDAFDKLKMPLPKVDISIFARIFKFLEHHSLINIKTRPPNRADVVSFASLLVDTPTPSEYPITADECVYSALYQKKRRIKDLNYAQSYCFACTTELFGPRYVHMSLEDFHLCPPCYVSGKYSIDMSSVDFAFRILPARPKGYSEEVIPTEELESRRKKWEPEETLRLLETLESIGEDWEQVARSIGNGKTPADCLQHFASLDSADIFLQGLKEGYLPGVQKIDHAEPVVSKDMLKLMVGECDNPLMSLVSLLASSVHPSIAAEAAKAGGTSLFKSECFSQSSSNPALFKSECFSQSSSNPVQVKDATEKAALASLESALQFSKKLAEKEERRIEILVKYLNGLMIDKLNLKYDYLMDQLENQS